MNDSVQQMNIDYLNSLNEDQMVDFLLVGLEQNDISPLIIDPKAMISTSLYKLYTSLDPLPKQRFKKAVVRMLVEWTDVYSVDTLSHILYLISHTRPTSAIDSLIQLLKKPRFSILPEKSRHSLTGRILQIISGFAPLPEVGVIFQSLSQSPEYEREYAAIIFTTLCKCYPREYYTYLLKFISPEIQTLSHITPETLKLIFKEFVKAVSVTQYVEQFSKLELTDVKKILDFTCNIQLSWSPFYWEEVYDPIKTLEYITRSSREPSIIKIRYNSQVNLTMKEEKVLYDVSNKDTHRYLKLLFPELSRPYISDLISSLIDELDG